MAPTNRLPAVRTAFVMEQTLGHVTHARNLWDVVGEHRGILPTWLPISFAPRGPARLLPVLRSNWSVRASWRARRALDSALAKQEHDAVVFHTQVTTLFSLGIIRRLPTVVSLDATPINYDSVGRHYGHRPAGEGMLDRHKYRMNRNVFHAASALVTWSDWARRSLVDDYGVEPKRVRVLAPGASASYFEIGERRLAGDPAMPMDRRVRLLFVGGDFTRKGGPLLIECMQGELAERCELHVVTQEAIAPRPNVHVHRGLDPNSGDLLRLFAEADVFVLPSMAECLAVALMEATAAGLPVVTTDVAALPEALIPNSSGFLIPPGDAGALREALTALVEDADLRLRMGRAGRALARQKFDARTNNRALLDLVIETVEAAREGRRAA